MSALKGGAPRPVVHDLLMAERSQKKRKDHIKPNEVAEGYVLESEEVGLSKTIDIILTKGSSKLEMTLLTILTRGLLEA